MAAQKMDNFITIEQAAEMTSMPVPTLREKVKQGLLRAYKPGKKLLFDPNEVRAFVKRFVVE